MSEKPSRVRLRRCERSWVLRCVLRQLTVSRPQKKRWPVTPSHVRPLRSYQCTLALRQKAGTAHEYVRRYFFPVIRPTRSPRSSPSLPTPVISSRLSCSASTSARRISLRRSDFPDVARTSALVRSRYTTFERRRMTVVFSVGSSCTGGRPGPDLGDGTTARAVCDGACARLCAGVGTSASESRSFCRASGTRDGGGSSPADRADAGGVSSRSGRGDDAAASPNSRRPTAGGRGTFDTGVTCQPPDRPQPARCPRAARAPERV